MGRERRSALLADIVNRRISLEEACQRHTLDPAEVEEWLRRFRRSALAQFDETLKQTLIAQGADANALTAAEFTGTLDDISVADLLQTIQVAGKDAVITVTRDGVESCLWCAGGAVVDAESGMLTGDAAAYRVLNFETGAMTAALRPITREPRIRTSTQRLLLEAARRKDECSRLDAALGPRTRRYQLGESSRRAPSETERSVLAAFDVPRGVNEVLLASAHGDLETLTALVDLVQRGHLRDAGDASVHPPAAPSEAPRPGAAPLASFMPLVAAAPQRGSTLGWAAAAVALGTLVSAAYWIGGHAFDLFAAAAPVATVAPQAPELESYRVSLRVEPSHARISLDGVQVGVGQFERDLLEDGARHELRADADGFIPTLVFFMNAAPPPELRLERLPTPPPPAASAEPHPQLPEPSPQRRRSSPARAKMADGKTARVSVGTAPLEAATNKTAVDVTTHDTSKIQIVD